jgi:MFS family permease
LWLAGGFVAYYSVNALFATHLQKDLHFAPGLVATPIFFANLGVFLAASGWGWWSDRWGRRWAIIIPALIDGCASHHLPACKSFRLIASKSMVRSCERFADALAGASAVVYLAELDHSLQKWRCRILAYPERRSTEIPLGGTPADSKR